MWNGLAQGWNSTEDIKDQLCSAPSNQKKHLWSYLCGKKSIFSLFWLYFVPLGSTFRTFRVWQRAQAGLSECPQCSFKLVPTRSIFGLFWSHFGLYLGYFGSGKWAKLVSLNVLSAFRPLSNIVPLNRGSHMA